MNGPLRSVWTRGRAVGAKRTRRRRSDSDLFAPAPPPEDEAPSARWKYPFYFVAALVRRTIDDRVVTLAAALAFVTVSSLVPLLAAFSFIGRQLFDEYRQKIVGALSVILPYGEVAISTHIQSFLEQSEGLSQIGLVTFALLSLAAFGTLEEILNRIWRVTVERPFKVRLLSFTLLLFWGPLLIGAAFSGMLLLEQQPAFSDLVREARLFQIAPFIIVASGLSMLYWLVPYAPVRFRAAMIGGVASAAMVEILRWAFRVYVNEFGEGTNLVYGGFAAALFFLLSIELGWVLVLLGCEIAYLVQHPTHYGPRPPTAAPQREAWAGLVALAYLVLRFRHGEPVTPLVMLEARLGLPADEVRTLLAPLVSKGFLAHPSPTDTDAYLLGRDPHAVPVSAALAAYELPRQQAVAAIDPALAVRLAELQKRLATARETVLANDGSTLTLADLLER